MLGIILILTIIPAALNNVIMADTSVPSLSRVARWGHTAIVEQLLENGADPNASDPVGRTALHYAARRPKVIAVLLKAGANPNVKDVFGNTPLHLAVVNRESVALLLEAGASPNQTNLTGSSPFDRAVRMGSNRSNLEVIRMLSSAGAK